MNSLFLDQSSSNSERARSYTVNVIESKLFDGYKGREIEMVLHRNRISEGKRTLVLLADIDCIVIGKNNKTKTKRPFHSAFFSILNRNGREFSFECIQKSDRYDIVLQILTLSGSEHLQLQSVADSIKKMHSKDTIKVVLSPKRTRAESKRKSLIQRTSDFLRSKEYTDSNFKVIHAL